MITQRRQEINEILRKNKKNSADAIEAGYIADTTKEFEEYDSEYGDGDNASSFRRGYMAGYITRIGELKISKYSDKPIIARNQACEEYYKFQKENKDYIIREGNGFIEVTRTFNISLSDYQVWLQEQKKEKNEGGKNEEKC